MKKAKKAPREVIEWIVPITYELRGSVVVEAETAEAAKEAAVPALEYDATFELFNYDVGTPRSA